VVECVDCRLTHVVAVHIVRIGDGPSSCSRWETPVATFTTPAYSRAKSIDIHLPVWLSITSGPNGPSGRYRNRPVSVASPALLALWASSAFMRSWIARTSAAVCSDAFCASVSCTAEASPLAVELGRRARARMNLSALVKKILPSPWTTPPASRIAAWIASRSCASADWGDGVMLPPRTRTSCGDTPGVWLRHRACSTRLPRQGDRPSRHPRQSRQ
jgi:hypothetical protein